MFEITGSDIQALDDADLRTVVARLAIAELRAQGCPVSSVTAGGHQDAGDGGLDVRVECPVALARPDFVPRQVTGFQVKKPDMPASAITEEMRPSPERKLREVIAQLVAESGAYIIVSAQGSVTDKALRARKAAMRDALDDLPAVSQLHTDFYDRDRLAAWINEYPGIAAWVKDRLGRGLTGWSSIGNWTDARVSAESPYLFNDHACLIDERSRERQKLTVSEGIARLRATLRNPKQCVRLVGLSGLGKTRFVQALFENGVGDDPLDPSIAVYTDYGTETVPAARDMARQLVASGQRAILIIDNCNPQTHSELARVCSSSASNLSLITVEYDVRADEPERTEVFRMQSSSPELVSDWLRNTFPHISQVDCRTIADFSGGNFRMARALAETLERGETLGQLKSQELFERIFRQRYDHDKQFLQAAQDLALLYSIDGENTAAGSELEVVGGIRRVDAEAMYEHLVELGRRGIAQSRSRWRAILPHALANPLAAAALERISPSAIDKFCAALPPRMQTSMSRRLGYLHDSPRARELIQRWLEPDGPLGDLLQRREDDFAILTNIAPVVPEMVLAKLEEVLSGAEANQHLDKDARHRWQLVRLIRALAYEPKLLKQAASLLAKFALAEPDGRNHNSACEPFVELFHLHLSGTRALPDERRAYLRELWSDPDPAIRALAGKALAGLLESHHFSSTNGFDFGARSRDWGWQPKSYRDIWDWYVAAIQLAVDLQAAHPEIRDILGNHIRGLWMMPACHDALEAAVDALLKDGPWVDGWLGFRSALRFEGKEMPEAIRLRLESIIQRLRPTDLLNQARAIVTSRAPGGWDLADLDDDEDTVKSLKSASDLAVQVGRHLAQDSEVRRQFLSELIEQSHVARAFECGRGLADGADNLDELWSELCVIYGAAATKYPNATVLGGFIREASVRDPAYTLSVLDSLLDKPNFIGLLPYLQALAGLNEDGIGRLRRALRTGLLSASPFHAIANGSAGEAPPEALASLLRDLASLEKGVGIALEILHMHFYCNKRDQRDNDPSAVEVGRHLLSQLDFALQESYREYGIKTVIRVCLAGGNSGELAKLICERIRDAFDEIYISSRDLGFVFKGLFLTHPTIALDTFLLDSPSRKGTRFIETAIDFGSPIDTLDSAVLTGWADVSPSERYPKLGRCIAMFDRSQAQEANTMSSLFLKVLEKAPDKKAFLGDTHDRLHPRGWSDLAGTLLERRASLLKLEEHADADIRSWTLGGLRDVDLWIDAAQRRNRDAEGSFE